MDAQTQAAIERIFEVPSQYHDIKDIIKYPPIGLAASSLTPLEKIHLGAMIMTVQPRIMVELGVLKAVTTAYLCAFLEANNLDTRVYGFDLPHVVEGLRRDNTEVQALEASGRLVLVPGHLPDSLSDWLATHAAPIDMALVDALHDYKSVTSELELLWPRLHPYGAILCHDYDQNAMHYGVRVAVDRFVRRKPDAQGTSFISPITRYDQVLRELPGEDIEKFTYVSTLALVRKRPYKLTLLGTLPHLWREAWWKWGRPDNPVRVVGRRVKARLKKLL